MDVLSSMYLAESDRKIDEKSLKPCFQIVEVEHEKLG